MKHKTADLSLGPGYRGRQARRAAFASRAKTARALKLPVRGINSESHNATMRAYADAMRKLQRLRISVGLERPDPVPLENTLRDTGRTP